MTPDQALHAAGIPISSAIKGCMYKIMTAENYTVVFYPESNSWVYRGRPFKGNVEDLIVWLRKL